MTNTPNAVSPPSRGRIAVLLRNIAKLAVLVLGTLIWLRVYGALNARGASSGRAAMFTPPLERTPWLYMPWMAWIYVVGGYLLCWTPYVWNWSWPRLLRVFATFTVGSCFLFLVYALWPVMIERPAYDSGRVGEAMMRQVTAVDQPANCFPSAHAFLSAASALLVWRSTRTPIVRWIVAILASLVIASTITVGQHYFMDAAAGIAVAAASVYVSCPRTMNMK